MLRLPKKFSSSFINRHFFPSYLQFNRLSSINTGRCYDWAFFAHRLFGVELWATDYHAWVEVWVPKAKQPEPVTTGGYYYGPVKERRYFDSETPKGVSSFMDLGCNIRCANPIPWESDPPKRFELEQFKQFWDKHGGGYKRHWDSMLEPELKKVLNKHYSEVTPIIPL